MCDSMLQVGGADLAVLTLKTLALTSSARVEDDAELDQEGLGDLMMDDNATAAMPRPGTSLVAPEQRRPDQVMRPLSSSGRPLTGFLRPDSSRPVSGQGAVEGALKRRGGTAGSHRPVTSGGREVRLATASLTGSGTFIDTDKLNLQRLSQRPSLAVVIGQYLLYYDLNLKRALEVASECTMSEGFKNWYWKFIIGRSYFKLGLFREAEKQLRSSLKLWVL